MKVVFLIGNIGSGKSSYADNEYNFPQVAIAKDDLRELFSLPVGKQYIMDDTLEEIIHDMTMDALEGFFHVGIDTVVIDETNMRKITRSPFLNLARKYGYKCEAVIFEDMGMQFHVNNRMVNNRGESQEYWEEVYTRKQKHYEVPTYSEGFDVITGFSWEQKA